MELQKEYAALQGLDAEVLAVSTDQLQGASRVLDDLGIRFPVLYDPSANVPKQYGVFNHFGDGLATSSTFIVDKEGVVRYRYVGRDIADHPKAATVLRQLRGV